MLCDNLGGWDGVGGEGEVQKEGTYIYTYGWFMFVYGRNQHNIEKILNIYLNKLKKLKKKIASQQHLDWQPGTIA